MSYWNLSNDGQSPFNGIISDASNIKGGSNPSFQVSDFLAMYPQFAQESFVSPNQIDIAPNPNVVPEFIIQMYIDLANASIKQTRWQGYWQIAMGWFIAHFCTLYLQGIADANSDANAVLAAGQAKGLNTSESVGDVSVSIDYNLIAQDLNGWAAWKLTVYGQQLATIGKLVGKGGMYVW
jgi:hypothetical protein